MKKIFLSSILLGLIFSTGACSFNNVYLNREQDNNEGKAFLNKFYANVINKNYLGVDNMVSDSLKELAGANGISKMVKYINNRVGNYKSYSIDDYYIQCITGSDNRVTYNYKLKVIYDKGIIEEIIGMRKQEGSEIKINSYHANSDLLMK